MTLFEMCYCAILQYITGRDSVICTAAGRDSTICAVAGRTYNIYI